MKKLIALSVLPLLVFASRPQNFRPRPAPFHEGSAPVWEAIGPYGGYVRALAANPADPNEIFAVAQTGQIFRSADGSRTWTLITVRDVALCDIACSPSRPGTLYVVSARGLFVSSDHGVQWTERLFPSGCSSTANIWVSPTDPDRIQVGGSSWSPTSGCAALMKSSDGGRTWTVKTFSCAFTGTCYRIAVDPSDPNIVYAGASFYVLTGGPSYYNFYKTSDGGETWRIVYGGSGPIAISVDPRNPLRVFASVGSGVGGGIMRTLDGGQTWTRSSEATAQSIVFDPLSPDTIYAGWGSTFFLSADGGTSWTRSTNVSDGFCTSILPLGGKILFGSTAGVSGSPDGGASWSSSDRGMNARNVPAFGVAPTDPATVYSVAEYFPQSSYTQGLLYKGTDSGEGWTKLSIWLSYDPANSRLVVDPLNGERLWVRDRDLWRSANGGLNWAGLPARNSVDDLADFAVSARTSGYLVIGGTALRYPGGLPYMAFERSFDAGSTWSVSPVTLEKSSASAIALDPSDGNYISVGGERGGLGVLFRSRDGGASWTEIGGNSFGTDPVLVAAIDPEDGNRISAGTAGGFFSTENGGTSWTKSASFPVRAIHILHADPRQILAAGASGIFWSGDRGRTWTDLGADLPSKAVNGMQLLPSVTTLYVGTPNGIYRRSMSFPARIFPPLGLTGAKVANRSLSQLETIHVLRWSPNPRNGDILKYRIYTAEGTSLGRPLAEQPASLQEFKVRNAPRNAVAAYAVAAVDKSGREGEPAFVIVN